MMAIDLFCGLGGWAEGFLAEGYDVIGFDIERRDYGTGGYPGQLVIQDVLTLHGSQFRNATCIVASPPCQKYSYMAMPWKRAKVMASRYRESPERIGELNALFDACFRIQREACEAANAIRSWGADCEAFGSCGRHAVTIGHFGKPVCLECSAWAWETYGPPTNEGAEYRYIPLVVENVKGAQPWVGSARWHYGSYYLWGDVPALMPFAMGRKSQHSPLIETPQGTGKTSWFFGNSKHEGRYYGQKITGYSDLRRNGGRGVYLTSQRENTAGVKQPGHSGRAWFADPDVAGHFSSKSDSRKAASAQIAKIPFPLANYIARVFASPVSAEASRLIG